MWPLPEQYEITTAYGKRGGSWSCDENSSGGIHTGCDMACPEGTPLYAAIPGEIRHRNYGSAFGDHQFAISPDPGQPFANGEVFYAHARKRLADGTRVEAGDWVGEAGEEGNASGPHLHFELHDNSKNSWNCDVHDNPQPALDWQPEGKVSYDYDYLGKPGNDQTIGTGYKKLDLSDFDPAKSGWEHTYVYLNIKPTKWQDSQETAGMVRFRIVRADGDDTAHEDLPIIRRLNPDGSVKLPGGTLDEDGKTLRHVLYWEAGDGKPTHVEIKCEGGLAEAVIGTRYTKKGIIY